MGAWGVAILSDDIAEDISFRFKDLLGDNFTNEEATNKKGVPIQDELFFIKHL